MCDCGNALKPYPATITKVIDETSDVKTFQVVFDDPAILENFGNKPGQCGMLSILGVGEAMISITSAPTRKGMLEFCIRRVGKLTDIIHELNVGDKIGIRGPYGSHFPYEMMKGKDLVFVAGGIGLAPLRSLIDYVLSDEHRDEYGKVQIIYGSRTEADFCFKYDLYDRWPKIKDTEVHTCVYREQEGWNGKVGFIHHILEELNPSPEGKVAVACGSPVAIKSVLESLDKMGYADDQCITTLELKMKCGIGKCGRCNIGDKFVCVDGPVFSAAEIKELPPEF